MDNIENINGPSLSQTTPVKCESCGCEVFYPAYLLRKVSRLLIGAQDDGIIPINTFACASCGHTNAEFIPPQLREDNKEKETKKEEPKSSIIMQ